HERGAISRAELDDIERRSCPGVGACAGQFTASTMAIAVEALGLAAVGDGLIPADDAEAKLDAAQRAATLAIALAENGAPARRRRCGGTGARRRGRLHG